MSRTISSPGVNVTETDQTSRPAALGGTSILIPGFAQFGPSDTVLNVSSMTEFERLYGTPTNAAERYFHATARAVFNSRSSVLATRIPYGSGGGLGYSDNVYTALFYPVFPVHRGSVAGHIAGTEGKTLGESAVTSMSAASAAFGTLANTSYETEFARLAPTGVSLSGVDGDSRLTFSDPWASTSTHREGLSAGYIFGKPQLVRMSKEQYQDLQEGNFSWNNFVYADKTFSSSKDSWGHAGIIITNIAKAIINDKYEGHYLAFTDNSQINPATDYDSVLKHYTVSETSSDLSLEVPSNRRNFALSGTATSNDNSTSEILEEVVSADLSTDDYNDTLILGIFRMKSTVYSTDTLKLDQTIVETQVGSLDSRRRLQSPAGGNPATFFLGDVEKTSQRIEILVNPFISFENPSWINSNGNLTTKFTRILSERSVVDSRIPSLSGSFGAVEGSVLSSLTAHGMSFADALVPLGDYAKQNNHTKEIGNVPDKLDRVFRSIENLDLVDIDMSVEAGLGTIYAGAKYNASSFSLDTEQRDLFDDQAVQKLGNVDYDDGTATTGLFRTKDGVVTADGSDDFAYSMITNYKAVADKFVNFAEFNRKDHLFIADGLRNIFVQGENGKVMTFDKRRTFTQFVYWPLRHLFNSFDSSYMATYGNWAKCYDGVTDRQHWCPFSGYAAAASSNTDASVGPWMAPAGFSRGRIVGATDLATVQSQKHRDQLYKININPVTSFPNDGFVVFGQKTMQKKPSAFDRINVRRLFLALEKSVRNSMKYYVFEPNTFLTRTKVLNTLTPMFNRIRNEQGMYDYLIVCDRRNNGSSIIDANELVVDIYVQPVRTAETILVNFYATRTGQDFSEIVS